MLDLFTQSKNIILQAGEMLKTAFYQEKNISTKSNQYDLVTDTDKAIEAFLIENLGKICPDSQFLAEESDSVYKTADKLWVIDPIDGTTNFVHKFPFTCISVAFKLNGKLEYGFVYNPIMGEFFTAQRGKGAYLNGKRIYVSKEDDFGKSFLATGFAYGFASAKIDNIEIFRDTLSKVHAVRRAGSAALDLCYVALGVFDGFWEFSLKAWDVCAGIIIVQEAGGKVTNLNFEKWAFSDDLIIASNGILHNHFLEHLASNIKKQMD
ncbi:MAG: inositol monophosphatase family protein [Candidatus Cloacimonadales bacterium]|nr:inositol monophosphatase [Candidatus Cloacimonadota bacterium]MDD2650739.1 inositol monophosphatase family protein [Candidatus Cloacimonadota bacterium]MDD3502337.1 inositol monophosphatase family protein [Candidatus Cloacimonadota bacterium]MDX9977521.1 inositol monophosphatase family protein [Candidatus Cloacimonadales bacterium]